MTARDIAVIKCGGHATVTPAALSADLAELTASGRPVVVVHGGSADIERLGVRLNVPMRRLTAPDGVSGRYTDPAALEVVTLALAGAVRPRLVAALLAAGVPAVGLTGIDGGLLRARRRRTQRAVVDGRQVIVRDDHSGRITEVNTALLDCLLAAGLVPVVSPPVLAEDGAPVNADADRAAAAIAVAMRADTLVLLTSAPGVLADPADPLSVLSVCEVPQTGPPAQRAGGMGVKLTAAREALAAGVREVLVADGRVPAPVSRALAGSATRVALATLMQGGRR
ncbi:MAG TPA: [LysW]-aminoadipate kinase [Streptosporangiaceae bacterium]|nr:[LysW]-aminoadipate kinase [Streptosporangiaceae bacterium]